MANKFTTTLAAVIAADQDFEFYPTNARMIGAVAKRLSRNSTSSIMSHIVSATLVTTEVEPGWPLTRENVSIGKRYRIDLDMIQRATLVNQETGQSKSIDIVFIRSPKPPGWFPLFAFKIDGDA